MTSFETAVTVLGALLMIGALVSGLANRSMLSLTALFVAAGFVLGDGGTGALDFDPASGFVEDLALLALLLILFRDGLEVEREMLQTQWRLPLRKLVLGMPITAGIVALAGRAIVGLSWNEAFLLGSILSATDPVLSSSVVTNPRVPRIIRHSLNLESGLNDGLALPPVLAFAAALDVTSGHFEWWKFVLQDVSLGVAYGCVVGWIASLLLPRGGPLHESMPAHQRSLYALGTALVTYGLTVAPPHGNGLIAVFVCAIVLGIRRPDIRHYFEARAEDIIEIVKLGIFVVFGSLLTFHGLFQDGWAAVAVVAVTLLLARPVALAVALAGTRLDFATKAFMAWFGPKGVSSMTFALIVLGRHGIASGPRIFNLVALVVVTSVFVHGITDVPGANWIARRGVRDEEPATPVAAKSQVA